MRMPIRFIWSGGVIEAIQTGIIETLLKSCDIQRRSNIAEKLLTMLRSTVRRGWRRKWCLL